MPNLKRLYISNCNFHGTIPKGILQHQTLEEFYGSNNNFEGTFPDWTNAIYFERTSPSS